jgi:FAD/FMN-containing dehydrogenase
VSRPDRVTTGGPLAGFRGALIRPGDLGYDGARQVFNAMIDRRPALIARCAGPEDISAAIRFAVDGGHPMAVRGGGHSVAGHAVCDGGVVIDLSQLTAVEVDPARRLARAQPGATWHDVDLATGRHGLATPGGVISTTGVAGFTLGGGVGWLSRRHGLACDNLVSATLVTADGATLPVSADENPEVLWGLRGGGGNFGVVTRFDYALHEIPEVIGGIATYAATDAESVIAHYQSVMDAAGDELSSILDFATAADGSGLPVVTLIACCTRTDEPGAEQVRRLLTVTAPGVRAASPPLVRKFRYPAWQRMLDHTAPAGRLNYWKTLFLNALAPEAAAAIGDLARCQPSAWSRVHLIRMGGRASRQAPGATAFSARRHPYVVHLIAAWTDPAATQRCVTWAKDGHDSLQPYAAAGAYLNFIGDEGQSQIRASFGEQAYERLARLKTRLDPANRFRLNQNISPSAGL